MALSGTLTHPVTGVHWDGNPVKAFGKPRAVVPAIGEARDADFPFFGCTDSAANGLVADLSSSQTANLTLIPVGSVDPAYRLYITDLSIAVIGPVAWASASTNPGVYIQDTNGNPLVFIPLSALQPLAVYNLGGAELASPLVIGSGQTITATWTQSTLTLLASAACFNSTANAMAGLPVTIIAGTGAGCSNTIKTNTTTGMVMNQSWLVTPDSTSVYAIQYYQVASGSTTTAVLTATSIVNPQNFSYYGLSGTSAYYTAPVKSASTVTNTLAYAMGAATAAGDIGRFTNAPQLNGIANLGVGFNWNALAQGAGLVAALSGTFSAGSNVRIGWRGFHIT